MATIRRRNTVNRVQRMVSRPKPEKPISDQDQLQLLLFQPTVRPKSLNIFLQLSVNKTKPNISLGLPQKPLEKMPHIDVGNPQGQTISFIEDQSQKRYADPRSEGRIDENLSIYAPRDPLKSVTVKNMPNTLPPIRFQRLENQSIKPYYINNLIKALDDQLNIAKLAVYREQFEQICAAVKLFKDCQVKPSNKIVLPTSDELRKTILLDLDQTLIHTNNTNDGVTCIKVQSKDGGSSSVKIQIRPYCRQFLAELSKIAQVVVFTAGNSRYADAVLDFLDPEKKLISHRLYREHCTFEKNYFVKDIREINRKLSDVVIVDNSPYSYVLNIENAVPILPYFGNSKDTELKGLLRYLRELVKWKDVRDLNRSHFKLAQYVKDYLSVTDTNYY